MSYQLRRDQSLGANLRRICRKELSNVLGIVRAEMETENSPVHETRKHLKKARAALQLLEEKLGHTAYKQIDHPLRDAGRLISEVRDAEVRLQTVRQLQEITRRNSQRSFRKTEQLLIAELEHFIAAFAGWQTQAEVLLGEIKDQFDGKVYSELDCKDVRCVIQQNYKSARNAFALVRSEPTPENFHEFRSRGKRLLYQLRILHPINPLLLRALLDELHALADVLGRSHDLHFLGERLRRADASPTGGEQRELVSVIASSETQLQSRGVDLAEHFFEERPRDFGNRLGGWLRQWLRGEAPTVADALVCENADLLR